MQVPETNRGAETLALEALIWTLQDDARAERLLALTGLSPDALRGRAEDPVLLAAVLTFLANHEADLLACAAAIGESPIALVAAARTLEA